MSRQAARRVSGRMRRRMFLALAALAAGSLGGARLARAQASEPGPIGRTWRSIAGWWDRLTQEPGPSDLEAKDATKYVAGDRPDPRSWRSGGITTTWIGHCTFLINLEGTTILTDPVFSERVGVRFLGLTTLGPERFVPPALTLQELPPIDLVLLSHAHMDHYDIPTLRRLPRDVPMILARDTAEFIEDLGFTNLQELDWGQSAAVKGVRVEALPVKHWGRRYPWDRDRGYNALLLTKEKRSLVFGGDSALTDLLPAAVQGRPLDAVMLSIGGYNPYIGNHASPEQAWEMFHAMEARHLIPMHWRTFRLSQEHPFEPYRRLVGAVNGSGSRVAIHAVGETWSLPS